MRNVLVVSAGFYTLAVDAVTNGFSKGSVVFNNKDMVAFHHYSAYALLAFALGDYLLNKYLLIKA